MDTVTPSPTNLVERLADAPKERGRVRFRDDQLPKWFEDRGRDGHDGRILPRLCGLYSPGHEVHWIPGIRSAGTIYDEQNRCRLVGVEGELLIVKARDRYRCYWNHEMERLLEEAGGLGRYVHVSDEWALLATGGSRFSLMGADRDEWRPCPVEPLPPVEGPLDGDDMVGLLNERGGFSIPFARIRPPTGRGCA